MSKNCCDIAWILAIGYMIMVPVIVILVGIIVGYYFKFKWGGKVISAKPLPFEKKNNKEKIVYKKSIW